MDDDHDEKEAGRWSHLSNDELVEELRQAMANDSMPVGLWLELDRRRESGFDLAAHDPELAIDVDAYFERFTEEMAKIIEPFTTRVQEAFAPLAETAASLFADIIPASALEQFSVPISEELSNIVAQWNRPITSKIINVTNTARLAELPLESPEIVSRTADEKQTRIVEYIAERFDTRLKAIEKNTSDMADAGATALVHSEQESHVSRGEFEQLKRQATAAVVVAVLAVVAAIIIAVAAS